MFILPYFIYIIRVSQCYFIPVIEFSMYLSYNHSTVQSADDSFFTNLICYSFVFDLRYFALYLLAELLPS